MEFCPHAFDITSDDERVYLKGFQASEDCAYHIFDEVSLTKILSGPGHGTDNNPYGAAFVATESGMLVVLSDPDPLGSSGTAEFGVFRPASTP